jgi:regulator of protease activity HflC (stomatin/prohibitin superfamily)
MTAKKNISLGLILFAFALNYGCGHTVIQEGYAGIKVNRYGSNKGVDNIYLISGSQWYNPITEQIYKFPSFMQTATWTKSIQEGSPTDESISFRTNDGISIDADISMTYRFLPEKVPYIFKKYRKSAEEIQATYLRAQVRNIFVKISSGYSVEDFIRHNS